jgi:hypothetical protein
MPEQEALKGNYSIAIHDDGMITFNRQVVWSVVRITRQVY